MHRSVDGTASTLAKSRRSGAPSATRETLSLSTSSSKKHRSKRHVPLVDIPQQEPSLKASHHQQQMDMLTPTASTSSSSSPLLSPLSNTTRKWQQIGLSGDSRLMSILSIDAITIDLLILAQRFDQYERNRNKKQVSSSSPTSILKEIDAFKTCLLVQGDVPNSWLPLRDSLWHPLLRAIVDIDRHKQLEGVALFGVFLYPGDQFEDFILTLSDESSTSSFVCQHKLSGVTRRIIGLPQHDGALMIKS
jgi:hypothetical protein